MSLESIICLTFHSSLSLFLCLSLFLSRCSSLASHCSLTMWTCLEWVGQAEPDEERTQSTRRKRSFLGECGCTAEAGEKKSVRRSSLCASVMWVTQMIKWLRAWSIKGTFYHLWRKVRQWKFNKCTSPLTFSCIFRCMPFHLTLCLYLWRCLCRFSGFSSQSRIPSHQTPLSDFISQLWVQLRWWCTLLTCLIHLHTW